MSRNAFSCFHYSHRQLVDTHCDYLIMYLDLVYAPFIEGGSFLSSYTILIYQHVRENGHALCFHTVYAKSKSQFDFYLAYGFLWAETFTCLSRTSSLPPLGPSLTASPTYKCRQHTIWSILEGPLAITVPSLSCYIGLWSGTVEQYYQNHLQHTRNEEIKNIIMVHALKDSSTSKANGAKRCELEAYRNRVRSNWEHENPKINPAR